MILIQEAIHSYKILGTSSAESFDCPAKIATYVGEYFQAKVDGGNCPMQEHFIAVFLNNKNFRLQEVR